MDENAGCNIQFFAYLDQVLDFIQYLQVADSYSIRKKEQSYEKKIYFVNVDAMFVRILWGTCLKIPLFSRMR